MARHLEDMVMNLDPGGGCVLVCLCACVLVSSWKRRASS